MEDVTEMLYLGVVISCDGKNTKNIQYKHNKSIGTKKQIMNMVKECGKYNRMWIYLFKFYSPWKHTLWSREHAEYKRR